MPPLFLVQKIVFVCFHHRGVLDVAAFLPRELWPSLSETMDAPRPLHWYHLILHLVTAADGAEEAFACDASVSAKEALRIDAIMHEVQSAHPAYVRIDNSTDFEGKLQRATGVVLSSLAAPFGSSRSYLTDGIGP